jgi:hypothetical protein
LEHGYFTDLLEAGDGFRVHGFYFILLVTLNPGNEFIIQNALFGIGPEILLFAFAGICGIFGFPLDLAFFAQGHDNCLHDYVQDWWRTCERFDQSNIILFNFLEGFGGFVQQREHSGQIRFAGISQSIGFLFLDVGQTFFFLADCFLFARVLLVGLQVHQHDLVFLGFRFQNLGIN